MENKLQQVYEIISRSSQLNLEMWHYKPFELDGSYTQVSVEKDCNLANDHNLKVLAKNCTTTTPQFLKIAIFKQ